MNEILGLGAGLLSMAINIPFTVRDMIENRKAVPINANTVRLVCAVTDDLPIAVRNSYCKSLEVVYATFIRSLLSAREYGRGNASAAAIFKAIPMLTTYDTVKFDKELKKYVSVSNFILGEYNGNKALDAFVESYVMKLNELEKEHNVQIGVEADVLLKESRGAVPTQVNISINVREMGGKSIEKNLSISVEVIPKVVSLQEMTQFFIKRKLDLATPDPKTKGLFNNIKKMFSLNFRRADNNKNVESEVSKTFNDTMKSIEAVKQPFVCIFMSGTCKDMIESAGLSMGDNRVIRQIYAKFPVMSISIYDANTDTITSSLTRDCFFTTRTASEFNSEISNYERQLSEMVRINKVWG